MTADDVSVLITTDDGVCRAALLTELQAVLDMADLPGSLRELIVSALASPGKLLAAPPGQRWPDWVLRCCVAAGGSWKMAVPAAIAVEFFMLGLDVLDEIEDDDCSPLRERYGLPLVLNGTTALLGLAQRAIRHLAAGGLPEQRVLRCHDILGEMLTTAAGGQHLDLSAEVGAFLTQQEILDLVARKSGALMGGCAALGATIAGAGEATQQLYRAFGCHAGIAAQLDNDMHDLWNTVVADGRTGKSDLRRRKQTVPLAFLRDTLGRVVDETDDQLATTLWESGALPYAWAVVHVHREEADNLLSEIDNSAPYPGRPRILLDNLISPRAPASQMPPPLSPANAP